MKRTLNLITAVLLTFLLSFSAWAVTPPKLFQTCLVRNGGEPLVSGDAAKIAEYDLAIFNRFFYDNLGGNAWAQIKKLNPATLLYLYEMGIEIASSHDRYGIEYLNDLGRYNVSRGHPMGAVNTNHPEFFLLDVSGKRIYNSDFSTPPSQYWYLLDFGSPAYQAYWAEAARNDIAAQKWATDGIFVDNCVSTYTYSSYTARPTKYPTDALWAPAMVNFVVGISSSMAPYKQKLFCNVGNTRLAAGNAAWKAIDASATPPDALHEEGAFVVKWGNEAALFFQESEWKLQVDLMSQIHHSKVVYESHCKLAEGASGTDNYGKPVTFWDAFWYAMCSYLIGKNTVDNNSYLAWVEGGNTITWHDEWTSIDLGNPVGPYQLLDLGTHIYTREYSKGFVYVNPTGKDSVPSTLSVARRFLNHSNLKDPASIVPSKVLSVAAHRGVISLK